MATVALYFVESFCLGALSEHSPNSIPIGLGAVAESVEHWPHVLEIVGSNPDGVKSMTYKIDTCHFLASG